MHIGAGDIERQFRSNCDISPLDEARDTPTNAPSSCSIVTGHSQGGIGRIKIMLPLPERGEAADNQLVIIDPVKISAKGQANTILRPIECPANLGLADVSTDIIPQHNIL